MHYGTSHIVQGLSLTAAPGEVIGIFGRNGVSKTTLLKTIAGWLQPTMPLHGHQEERFFHGYYDGYCYLPLFVFLGRHLLAAKLRPSNIDAAAGSLEIVQRIVAHVRERWPEQTVLLRADSGFCREELMAWCEANGVHYVFGLARNARLVCEISSELDEARAAAEATGRAARVFKDFTWRTLDSWSTERRVVAKADWTHGEGNPRFIVTSLLCIGAGD